MDTTHALSVHDEVDKLVQLREIFSTLTNLVTSRKLEGQT